MPRIKCDISPMEISLRLANTRKQSVASSICPIESVRELFCGVPSLSRGICSYNFCLVHITYYCIISLYGVKVSTSRFGVQSDFARISRAKIGRILETCKNIAFFLHSLRAFISLYTHPDPLMGRGYLSVRATGGAVGCPPWRGRGPGVGCARPLDACYRRDARNPLRPARGVGVLWQRCF